MNIPDDVLKEKEKLEAVINQYLLGETDLIDFEEKYTSQLELYKEVMGDRGFYLYYDTCNVVETISTSKMVYKEDEINNLKIQLEEIQSAEFEKLKKYYPLKKIDESLRKRMCRNALFEINQSVKHVTVHNWIEEKFVVDDGEFDFFRDNGTSKLGNCIVLYRTPIFKRSFLLSTFNSTIVKPSFSIEKLLKALKKVNGSQECFWVQCHDCDGVLTKIRVVNSWHAKDMESTWNVIDPYTDLGQLAWFEEDLHNQHQANGEYNLLLLSSDYRWMLKVSYSFEEWWIELHGENVFLSEFTKELDYSSGLKK